MTLEDLKRVAHLSQERAAAALNVGNTRFKSACRELGMRGWPYRKIKSVRSLLYAIQKEPDSVHPVSHMTSWVAEVREGTGFRLRHVRKRHPRVALMPGDVRNAK